MTAKITVLFCLMLLAQCVEAQEVLKLRPSPLAITSVRYKDTYLKITYSQPQKKGRDIFGNLVPFGQVWRTGANEATEITATREIQLGPIRLAAGTYSLFTIPEKEKWTIIINADLGLWGAYNYNPAKDVWRFEVPVQPSEKMYEPFTIIFDHRNEVADLLMMWENTTVSIPVKFID